MTRNATLREYLDFAVETAYQAGRMTLGYIQAGVIPDFKAATGIELQRGASTSVEGADFISFNYVLRVLPGSQFALACVSARIRGIAGCAKY